MDRINCLQCAHYHSTWDPQAPRGCKKYGIKSNMMPSYHVKKESGNDCYSFEKKEHFKKKKGELDLNDPNLW